ncbi:MAG TPA: hypothetical protein VKM55_15210 [Candidatus Lokiarchaeia archaeon]|nr:hypothetical protein [Candidatus Lokiarchaeia archaeon]
MKREARQFLEKNKDSIDYLLIDGTLERDEKVCGCCGPPPSPDYKIQVLTKDCGGKRKNDQRTAVAKDKIVRFKINKQLYNAITNARLNIVIFYLETTDEAASPSTLVAKFI